MDRPEVVVIGSINVDVTVHAPTLPGRGETVVGGELSRSGGGKGANAAVAAARAGATVRLVAAVGDDEAGRAEVAALRDEGIDVSGVRVLEGAATGAALIVVDRSGDNQIAVASGANHALCAEAVAAALAAPGGAAAPTGDAAPGAAGAAPGGAAAPTGDAAPGAAGTAPGVAGAAPGGDAPRPCFLVSFEIPDAAVVAAAQAAVRGGAILVVNPAPARPLPAAVLAARPILTPNQHEAAALTGEDDPRRAAAALSAQTGAPVVVTLGADGALLDGTAHPAPPVVAVDATGAGDVFNGALAAALAAGQPLQQAVGAAIAAAADSVTRAGARAST